ncbi:MAG: alpha-amylase family glycosyl hydrolase, partial [Oscillospiraceae bacterium]
IADDFVLIGEMLFGDYNGLVNDEMLYSCTNYECYKGVHSSLNENNLFEIAHSLNRQFGKENWSLYRGKHLLNFVDNHDVSRIASILKEKRNINSAYALMFSMPGVPCIYYGSEWGIEGDKASGDNALRPCFDVPVENEMTDFVRKLAQIKKTSKALCYGDFENVQIQNKALAFKRCFEGENIFVCINIAPEPVNLDIKTNGNFVNLLTEETVEIDGGVEIKPFGVMILRQNV